MASVRRPPTAGIAASLVTLAVVVVPIGLVDGSTAFGAYYGGGAVNGLAVGLFAIVATVVFAAGREERSSPDLVAGATLVLGLFAFVLALVWALTVPEELIFQLGTATVMEHHRWALVVATLGMPASALWYARALRLL